MKEELGDDEVLVIGTGGLANMIATQTDVMDYVDGDLTLEGLRLIYEKNKA